MTTSNNHGTTLNFIRIIRVLTRGLLLSLLIVVPVSADTFVGAGASGVSSNYAAAAGGGGGSPVLEETTPPPTLGDYTVLMQFSSDTAGAITYGGTCGDGDLGSASVGSNTVTWTHSSDATHSNCTITVGGTALNVTSHEVTDKYPVLLIHGLWGSPASAWTNNDRIHETGDSYLVAQGWDDSRVVAYQVPDNSDLCDDDSNSQVEEVEDQIDDLLTQFPGFTQVDLVGHSRGGNNIMRGIWHGFITTSKVRRAITLSGSNRACTGYGSIPTDETTDSVEYWVICSDPGDSNVSCTSQAYVYDGAYYQDLDTPSHCEMKGDYDCSADDSDALLAREAIVDALSGDSSNFSTTPSGP